MQPQQQHRLCRRRRRRRRRRECERWPKLSMIVCERARRRRRRPSFSLASERAMRSLSVRIRCCGCLLHTTYCNAKGAFSLRAPLSLSFAHADSPQLGLRAADESSRNYSKARSALTSMASSKVALASFSATKHTHTKGELLCSSARELTPLFSLSIFFWAFFRSRLLSRGSHFAGQPGPPANPPAWHMH